MPTDPATRARTAGILASLTLGLALVATGLGSSAIAQSDAPSTAPSSAVPFGDPHPLSAGTYYGDVGAGQWTVTVPEGWEWFYDILWSDLGVPGTYMDVGGAGEVALGWWQIANVFADPCHWQESLADPPVGPTVDDLATALQAQVGRGGTTPTDVVLGGLPAKRVELSIPADLDVATCDQGVYREFLGPGEQLGSTPEFTPDVAGRVDVLYILDIEGDRWVMRTWHRPDASDADLAEMEAMLGSVVIGPRTPEIATPVPSPTTPASPRPAIGQTADDGARIVAIDTVDARTRDLTIESPSVGTVQVRLVLPSGFDADGGESWPVLYLLHGYGGSHEDWTSITDVEGLTAPTDLLVVMPDADEGWYTDAKTGGQANWETFHTTELIELLERNWQAGDRRVVAGLSMGGLGAMDYAARHPGMFRAAASYSGVLDTIDSGMFRGEEVFGDPYTAADDWTAHNPLDLAPALKGPSLYVSYGDGRPGPLDPVDSDPDDIEGWIAPMNDRFVARLAELGIPATVDAYGPGGHDAPYWERALHDSLPMLLRALGDGSGITSAPGAASSAP